MSVKLERDKQRLREVCALVEANKADGESLFRERDDLLRGLKASGVPNPELVALSQMTPRTLKWVLTGGREARMAKKAAAKKKAAKKRPSKKKATAKKRAARSA